MKISEVVREAAKASGLTMRELEAKTGVPLATLNRFLTEDADTRVGAVDAIAAFLRIEATTKGPREKRRRS